MGGIARMVIDDPAKMSLLTKAIKQQVVAAAIRTVNIQAAVTRKNSVATVKGRFTLRNSFTTRQISYEPCKVGSVQTLGNVSARVGASEKVSYMARQESGGEHTNPSGHSLLLPTTAGARRGSGANKISKRFYYENIRDNVVKGEFKGEKGNKGTAKSRYVAASYVAWKEKLFRKVNDRVFLVQGFSKKGGEIKFTEILIYDLSKESTKTPANPWLWPSSQQPAADCQNIFNREMDKVGL